MMAALLGMSRVHVLLLTLLGPLVHLEAQRPADPLVTCCPVGCGDSPGTSDVVMALLVACQTFWRAWHDPGSPVSPGLTPVLVTRLVPPEGGGG
jgi:hypothetical protein